jgi:hypothetical protein
MNQGSIGEMNARYAFSRGMARLNGSSRFRLARIGPGWVLGSLEAVCGNPHPGTFVAGMYFESITSFS